MPKPNNPTPENEPIAITLLWIWTNLNNLKLRINELNHEQRTLFYEAYDKLDALTDLLAEEE